jgi:hypothetical protein
MTITGPGRGGCGFRFRGGLPVAVCVVMMVVVVVVVMPRMDDGA